MPQSRNRIKPLQRLHQAENTGPDFLYGTGAVDLAVLALLTVIPHKRLGLCVISRDSVCDRLVRCIVSTTFDARSVLDALPDHFVRNHDGNHRCDLL